ncbi:Increased rDNA silencing protein [Exophiala xenobiotica]|uniref:Increased rDNA silencing protein n=1 Tax=Lithohypha guttulata TaxID=1690604 RepID=A0ABR0KBA0_9EURO|nr:Increased rDNA silencing protein [Lithohypha guttulata]KAK5315382.1 Increased rDNA silencing protein [Exophiala xenobiotica]
MSQHHRSWKPSTAAKPSHLASVTSTTPSKSLAALQGATTAFITKPKATSSAVKQLRSQYEPAHAVVSSHDTRGRFGEGPDAATKDSQMRRSPSRGRHISPEHARLAGARTAASGARLPVSDSMDRTSSMIAARLVSASPSPTRGLASVRPPAEPETLDSASAPHVGDKQVDKNDAAPAVAASRGSHHSAAIRQTTVKSLSLGKIPRLPPKHTAVVPRENRKELKANTPQQTGSLPIPIPLKRANTHADDIISATRATPSNDVPISLERSKPSAPAARKGRPLVRSPLQADLTGSKQHQRLSRQETISRMADAMVASSLASTRTSSPTKALQGHASKRRSASAHNLHRLPSTEHRLLATEPRKLPTQHKPQRPMKQTLRKSSPDDEDDNLEIEKRGRRHLVRKHPNMHREGDRRRWRDKVTEMERKRYEGVFAANRGLLLKSMDPRASPSRIVDPSSESNQVVNVVVRDIWERSRLPHQVLEQIYDLVAPRDTPALGRDQFVVGLWLIDQKLRGRKLPVKVSESVWSSVRHYHGIKV